MSVPSFGYVIRLPAHSRLGKDRSNVTPLKLKGENREGLSILIVRGCFGHGAFIGCSHYHLIRLLAHVRPPPNAVRTIKSPLSIDPSRTASSRAIGIVAEEILAYFSMVR
jgi:hypothetical protein